MIENVSLELKKYLERKPFFSSLIGFDMIILYGSVVLAVLGLFFFLGGFISAVVTYAFLLGIVLALANQNFSALMIGLGARAAISLISAVVLLLDGYLSWESLITACVFGLLAYGTYTKTMRG